MVLEALKNTKTLAQLSSDFGIHAQQITDWKRQVLDGIPTIFEFANQLGSDRSHLIESAHPQLSISQQCALLSIPRSSYYYQPVGESATNLALMLRIDKLFTDRPEMGVRRMHQELTNEAEPLNIKRIRRLMRLMGLEAVGPKPNLSKPQPGHTIYRTGGPAVFITGSVNRASQSGLVN